MIRFQNVSLKIGNKQILNRFSINIDSGTKVVLAAPSGSGKTCLLKLIMGFINAGRGTIEVNGLEVKPYNMQQIRSMIGYMSQDIDFPNGRVDEVFSEIFISIGNKHLCYSTEKLRSIIKELTLPDKIIHKNTADISGGERQRLGWAFIMLLDRPILLLDEPTSALDEKQKAFFVNYILGTNKTVICASHDHEWQVSGTRVISQLLMVNDHLYS